MPRRSASRGYTPTAEAAATLGKGRVPDARLQALISTFVGQSYRQIVASLGMSDPEECSGSSDDPEEDEEGFYPDEDSELDEDPGMDESAPANSPWDFLDDHVRASHRQADVILVPGDQSKSWRAVLVRPTDTIGCDDLPAVVRAALLGRDRTVLAVAQALADQQGAYLRTLNPGDLIPVTQKDLSRFAGVSEGRLGRALDANLLELPDGRVVPFGALLTDADRSRAEIIRKVFLERDEVRRIASGRAVEVKTLIAWQDVVKAVQKQLGAHGNREGNVRRAAAKFHLPANVETRRKAYLNGADWWTESI